MLESTVATVFGGSGFIGRYVVRELARQGLTVRVPTRAPASAAFLRTMGVAGQVNPVQASLRDEASLRAAIKGSHIVINLIGQLAESRGSKFSFVQAKSAGTLARLSREAGAVRFIQLSAIGSDPNSLAEYGRSKAEGERQVLAAFPEATILRPSIVFGPEDEFFNRFAAMALLSPALPLIGGGKTKFQPVYVGDVATAIVKAANDPATQGKLYELGGPDIRSFRQLIEMMLRQIDRQRALVPLPFRLARLQASFLELLPVKLLTRDQVELLKRDNVVSAGALNLATLGITPTALDIILPTYLSRFRKGGSFHEGPHKESVYS